MTLLQISEPGESGVKAVCRKQVVGIDLGTTHSLVAVVSDGNPMCIPDTQGKTLLPSVVSYRADGSVLVGSAAVVEAAVAPQDTVVSVKRLMGRSLREVQAQPTSFASMLDISGAAEDMVRLRVTGPAGPATRAVTPVEVSAEILRVLRERAEQQLGGSLDGVVITVPAYFDEAQRQATQEAGKLAGLHVLRLVNEPTAAALAYGLDHAKEGIFAVYDLGGGTFDLSILSQHDGVFSVLSTAGDTALGGDDMDQVLVDLVCKQQTAEVALAIRTTPTLYAQCVMLAKQAKHQLTPQEQVEIASPSWMPAGFQPCKITRDQFEHALDPLLDRTLRLCQRALRDAQLTVNDIQGVVMVGGATRVPLVQRKVGAFFQQQPLCDLNPDEVVALGAAIQAEVLTQQRTDVLLIDVTPLSLGLVTMGDVVETILPRNTRIPAVAKQEFTTYADGQTGFDLHIVQGERDQASQCRSLGRFLLRGIPPMPAGTARLEVTFLVDENGLLQVEAIEKVSGQQARITAQPSSGLSPEDIERMLLDSYAHAAEDAAFRKHAKTRAAGEQLLVLLQKSVAEGHEGWSTDEHAWVVAQTQRLQQALQAATNPELEALVEQIEKEASPLFERLMNRSIQQELSGKPVSAFE